MMIEYHIVNPTENITALVTTPIAVADQPDVACRIMDREPSVEQVGFLNGNDLRMAGGEFCGNASMSAAALICFAGGLAPGQGERISLKVSGVEADVNVDILCEHDGGYTGTVNMPNPQFIETVTLSYDGREYSLPVVRFDGISHIISEGDLSGETAEKAIKKWCNDLGADSLGIMLLDRECAKLKPLVFVAAPETLVWESSCASGTSAVGAYIFETEKRPVELTLGEPGGDLTVYANGSSLCITGRVSIIGKNQIVY